MLDSATLYNNLGEHVPISTYQAARAIARTVETHFRHHHQITSLDNGIIRAAPPTATIIETLLDTTFWASLRREEGFVPKISIAFLSPDQTSEPMVFGEKIPFTPYRLTKLAPAVERPGIHLGVWIEDGQLYIWGTTRIIPALCFVVEVVEPGVLVIKHKRRDGYGKFVNVAVMSGEQVKIIDEGSTRLPDCPSLIHSMIGYTAPFHFTDSVNILVLLAVSMRAHGRGGILLVVPSEEHTWQDSILHPISYAIKPNYHVLAELNKERNDQPQFNEWQSKLSQAVSSMAGLTAVDGATIINDQYELLAFGAKIGRAKGKPPVKNILVTEPVMGFEGKVIAASSNGGTRHLSAAQFVSDQKDAIALVASQDGRFTIFTWSNCESMVQAHRVDALLL